MQEKDHQLTKKSFEALEQIEREVMREIATENDLQTVDQAYEKYEQIDYSLTIKEPLLADISIIELRPNHLL
jgi:hypothetical protein